MVTLDQLKTHIEKAQSASADAAKKAEDPKNDLAVRLKRKKVKRLQRKASKIDAAAKMIEEKKKPKKERKKAAEG